MASDDHDPPALALLTSADPTPVSVINPGGSSQLVFIGDHAGNVIPSALGSLGLGGPDLSRHIGWDIGVGALGALLADAMDATFIRQTYSRLVIDCNRSPAAADAIPQISDGTPVPGNDPLSPEDRMVRRNAIHEPYHRAIDAELGRRRDAGQSAILIALHSFTPALRDGVQRPWHIGVLHDAGDTRFALNLLDTLRQGHGLVVGDNEPYRMDQIDYTIPRHAYLARLPYAELEIRQDLLLTADQQADWCGKLAKALRQAS